MATNQHAAAVAADCCEVYVTVSMPRDARIVLLPRRHQRFCESCADEVHTQGRAWCPGDGTPMVAAAVSSGVVFFCVFSDVIFYYLRQGGYVIVVCLLTTLRKNIRTDLHEIFRKC